MPSRYGFILFVAATACSGGGSGSSTGPGTTVGGVATVTISGATSSQIGQTTKLTAVAKDASGAVVSDPITWSSSDQTLIAVAADGTVSADRIASVTITAIAGGKSANVTFTSALAPYTFAFPAGTSAADQQLIRDGVQYAHAFHLTTFGRTITQATTITGATSVTGCDSRSGNAAFTGPNATTFCVANLGWTNNGPIQKQKIVQHELFHVWQFEYHWIGNPATAGPDWIIEGSAELMGFRGIAARNLLAINTALGCQVKQFSDFAVQQPPGLPALSTVEAHAAFQSTIGPLYALSMIGMDQIVTTPGLVSLKTYGDAIAGGTAWQTAFQTAFGTSIAAFYTQFPAYKAGLTVPPNYLCGV